ncbi:MAG: PaaI family thioesterase [Bacteroidota bacterium]
MSKQLDFLKRMEGLSLEHGSSPFGQWLDGKVLKVDLGYSKLGFYGRLEMLNSAGFIHEGIIGLLVNEAIGLAISTLGLPSLWCTTDLSMEFFGNAWLDEKLTVTARVVGREGPFIKIMVSVRKADGTKVAMASSDLTTKPESG